VTQVAINSISPDPYSLSQITSEPLVDMNTSHSNKEGSTELMKTAAMRREMFKAKQQNFSVETDDSSAYRNAVLGFNCFGLK